MGEQHRERRVPDGQTGPVYYLVAGRWFSAPDFTGPWTFATPSLPEDFKKIPLEHERSRVLASVPGTDQAAEAVLARADPADRARQQEGNEGARGRVPGRSAVRADRADHGSARGEHRQGRLQGRRDLLHVLPGRVVRRQDAHRDRGKSRARCPQEIYKIPVSSPAHHVTYVTVEESDDDWVMFAAAAGYTGMMVAWGCTVWGTGWYYPPVLGIRRLLSVLLRAFPDLRLLRLVQPMDRRVRTQRGASTVRTAAPASAPATTRAPEPTRAAPRRTGLYGARGVAQAYNPRTGTYAATRQGSNVYGSWGSTAVQRGDDWAKTNRYTNRQTGTTTRTIRTDEGGAVTRRGPEGGSVAAGSDGNVYAGKDGNVYRREDGTWQKYDNGGWSNTDRQPADRPEQRDRSGTAGTVDRSSVDSSTMDQLNRDARARTEGSTRTRDYGTYKGGGGGYAQPRQLPRRRRVARRGWRETVTQATARRALSPGRSAFARHFSPILGKPDPHASVSPQPGVRSRFSDTKPENQKIEI